MKKRLGKIKIGKTEREYEKCRRKTYLVIRFQVSNLDNLLFAIINISGYCEGYLFNCDGKVEIF